MRIRFRQVDVPHSTVHGPDGLRGFPLPPIEGGENGLLWEPFQIEVRGTPESEGEKHYTHIRLAVWERLLP